jgi:adenosine deaminase
MAPVEKNLHSRGPAADSAVPPVEKMIDEIPKAELHIHIEGTLEPELLLRMAKRNKAPIGQRSLEEIRGSYKFSDLQSFLNIYYAATGALIQRTDFVELTDAYLRRAAKQGVRHAEIFFDPQAHTSRGVKFETVVSGISEALATSKQKYGITSMLIMCFLRDRSAASAEGTLDEALAFRDIICAVGLDSAEMGNPPSKFADVFRRARREGFRAVAHAGEEAPVSYVWEAIDSLGVERIDHGYSCVEDPALLRRLAKDQIPLTMCPLTSLAVHYFKSISDIPLKNLMNSGLLVSLHSDDPAYFGGYIADNYKAAWRGLDLSKSDLLKLFKNSITSSFLDAPERQFLLGEIDRTYAKWAE